MSKNDSFVYLWFDSNNKKFYLGKHKGTPDDSYTHSSTIWKRFKKDNIPTGVRRRILAYGTDEEICILEHELLKNRKARRWNKYYNRSLGDPRYVDQSGENSSFYKHGLFTGSLSSDPEILARYKQNKKQWRKDNKEKIAEQKKQYRKNNKEKIAEDMKQYRKDNKEKIAEYQKQYHKNNKEKIAEYQKQYHKDNKEKIAEYRKDNKEKLAEYRKNNKEKLAEYKKQYHKDNKEKIAEYLKNNKEKIAERKKQYYKNKKKLEKHG